MKHLVLCFCLLFSINVQAQDDVFVLQRGFNVAEDASGPQSSQVPTFLLVQIYGSLDNCGFDISAAVDAALLKTEEGGKRFQRLRSGNEIKAMPFETLYRHMLISTVKIGGADNHVGCAFTVSRSEGLVGGWSFSKQYLYTNDRWLTMVFPVSGTNAAVEVLSAILIAE